MIQKEQLVDKRKIYLFSSNKCHEPIITTYGTDFVTYEFELIDYKLKTNDSVRIISYSVNHTTEIMHEMKASISVENNTFYFKPEVGFFEVGQNGYLIIEVNTQEGTGYKIGNIKVVCFANKVYGECTPEELETVKDYYNKSLKLLDDINDTAATKKSEIEQIKTNAEKIAKDLKDAADKGEFDGRGIKSTTLNPDYTLTITFTDNTTYTTGSIRGQEGLKGDRGISIQSVDLNASMGLTITLEDGSVFNTSSVQGPQGEPGKDYVLTEKDKQDIAEISTDEVLKTTYDKETIDKKVADATPSDYNQLKETVEGKVNKEEGKGLFSGKYEDLTGKPAIPPAYDDEPIKKEVGTIKKDLLHQSTQIEELDSEQKFLKNMAEDNLYSYEEVESEAYSVDVPSGAKLASVNKICGRSIVWKQLVKYSTVSATLATKSVSFTDGKCSLTFTASGTNSVIRCYFVATKLVEGHKYYSKNINGKSRTIYDTSGNQIIVGINEIFTVSSEFMATRINISDGTTRNANDIFEFEFPMMFDLTQMFGEVLANRLTEEDCHNIFYKGYYPNEDAILKNAEVENVVVKGVNLWDEEWINTYIDRASGIERVTDNCISSKNYNEIEPNQTYYLSVDSATTAYYVGIILYDSDKKYIDGVWISNRTVTTPNNARYFRLTTMGNTYIYGGVYKNDIALVKGTSGSYVPYKEPVVKPISEIVAKYFPNGMKSVGTVKDELDLKNGVAVRNIAEYTFTGKESWNTPATNAFYLAMSEPLAIELNKLANVDNAVVSNIMMANYQTVTWNALSAVGTVGIAMRLEASGGKYFRLRDASLNTIDDIRTAITGQKIYYELATPIETPIDPTDLAILRNLEVEQGGTITFEQEDIHLPIANTIEYLVKNQLAKLSDLKETVFIATYGVTTVAEIREAIANKKNVYAQRGNVLLPYVDDNDVFIYFGGFVDSNQLYYMQVRTNSSNWTAGSYSYQPTEFNTVASWHFPSSKAIADFLSANYQPKEKQYELIEEITVAEDTPYPLSKTSEPNGTPYNFDAVFIYMRAPDGVTKPQQITIYTQNANTYLTWEFVYMNTAVMHEVKNNKGLIDVKICSGVYNQTSNIYRRLAVFNGFAFLPITKIGFTDQFIPVGTVIKIFGIRR